MSNGRIENRRPGRDSTQKIAHSIHRLIMLPRIFKYLIGAKDVEIRMRGESVLENKQSTV